SDLDVAKRRPAAAGGARRRARGRGSAPRPTRARAARPRRGTGRTRRRLHRAAQRSGRSTPRSPRAGRRAGVAERGRAARRLRRGCERPPEPPDQARVAALAGPQLAAARLATPMRRRPGCVGSSILIHVLKTRRPPMHVALTPEQRELQQHLRGYFAAMMTPELQAEIKGSEGGGPLYRLALEKMGADGWLGIGWPKEYGGQGRTPIEQMIFADEVQSAGFPLPFLTLNTVGPTLAAYGSEELKREFVPRILAGKCHFSIGYSEPGAGTDLASLTTRAVRDGEEWVINGQKVFTSLADFADYVWLAARTDPDAPKHRGISMFIVPTTSP